MMGSHMMMNNEGEMMMEENEIQHMMGGGGNMQEHAGSRRGHCPFRVEIGTFYRFVTHMN